MVWACSTHWEKRNIYIDGFVGKLEGKKSFGRPRRRREHNKNVSYKNTGRTRTGLI